MVALTIGAVDDLAGHQRRHGGKGIQQPAVKTLRRGLCRQKRGQLLSRDGKRVALALRGRQMVVKARQDLPLFAHFKVDAAQAVENAPILAR